MGSCCSGCLEGLRGYSLEPGKTHEVIVVHDEDEGVTGATTVFQVPAKLQLLGLLGVGSYGVVAAFTDRQEGRDVAVKKMQNAFSHLEDGKRSYREIRLMRQLRHPHVLEIYDMLAPPSSDFDDIYLVMPLVETDLYQLIYGSANLTDLRAQRLTYQMLLGVAYLHSAGVVHRDLKPANVLVGSSRSCASKAASYHATVDDLDSASVKLCDFGLARVLDEEAKKAAPCPLKHGAQVETTSKRVKRRLTVVVATVWYRAPEVTLFPAHYSFAIDVWSVGCILAEMVSKKPLFDASDDLDQLKRVVAILGTPSDAELQWLPSESRGRAFLAEQCPAAPAAKWSQLLPYATDAACAAVKQLVAFDPTRRPQAAEALRLPYLQDVLTEADIQATRHAAGPLDWSFDDFEPTREKLTQLVYEECAFFHPELRNRGHELNAHGREIAVA